MSEHTNKEASVRLATRRQAIVGGALAMGGMFSGLKSWGQVSPAMAEKPSAAADSKRTALHQEVDFNATPQRLYDAILDSKQFAAFSGMPADIKRENGGAFSMFGGLIEGRNIELVPNQRIVQAWRPANWPPGLYSLARFEFKLHGTQTRVVLDHSSFPEGGYQHLSEGWYSHYWEPLKKYLA